MTPARVQPLAVTHEMRRDVFPFQLGESRQSRHETSALGPEGGADEAFLCDIHHRAPSHYCGDCKAIAQRFTKNHDVRVNPEREVDTANVHSEARSHLVENEDGTYAISNAPNTLKESLGRATTTQRLHDDRCN